jgi:hypothetical protein
MRDRNEYVVEGSIARIILYNYIGEVVSETTIDAEDVDRCKKYKWHIVLFGKNKKPYVATNTKSRKRLTLQDFLMDFKGNNMTHIDHINRNTLDNKKENFRICEHRLNIYNAAFFAHNTSGYKGVSLQKKSGKWRAVITALGQQYSANLSDTPEEAALKYNELAQVHHGEFAYLNEVRT